MTTTNTNEIATKRLRLQRLIGLDETKGTRGDLARARAMAARGYNTANGRPIGDEIARLEAALTAYTAALEATNASETR